MILDESGQIIEHFGVKGMRWGSRKSAGSSTGSSPPKKSRKEKKVEKKEAKKAERTKIEQDYEKAVHKMVAGASKRGNLIELRQGNRRLILTGEETANLIMQRNGAVPTNVMWTELELDRRKG